MRLLLDTCAFLWWDQDEGNLGPAALAAIAEPSNELFLSHVSIWEMQIKRQRGKLHFRKPLEEIIQEQCAKNGLQLLPIEPLHIFRLDQLPLHHGDPFDRLMISQAVSVGMAVVTNDPEFHKYGVNIVW